MEALNAILLTRLTRFHLREIAELYRRAGSATTVIEHKNDIREILPDASKQLVEARGSSSCKGRTGIELLPAT